MWLAVIAVLVATLWPTRSRIEGAFFDCLVCGERGLADVILNIALFLPFGAAMALGDRSWRRALLYAVLLSIGVELQQQGIPGRHSSVGDLIFNTTGAALGVLLVKSSRHWLRPRRSVAAWLSLFAAGTVVGVIALTGWLLAPQFPQTTYHVQWTPRLSHLERYEGNVIASALGPTRLRPGPLANSREVARQLERGDELAVRATGATHRIGLASMFSIYDDRRQEIILVGPDRGDLVLRVHSRASLLRLDQPDMRVAGALREVAEGDSLDIRVRLGHAAHCIAINGHSSCSYGFSAGRGWAILLYLERFPPWVRGVLDATWMAMLCFPIGLWARRRKETAAALALAAVGIVAVPAVGPLLAAPVLELGGALAGTAAGWAMARFVRQRNPSRGTTSLPVAGGSPATGQPSDGRDG